MIRQSTSIVLGSGGARGLTHIGVIRCLEENGYDIRYVAGSSIGAAVGGIYAAGKLDVYADWVSALEKSDVRRLMDWSLIGGSLIKGERLINTLRDLIGERNIEDLPIGFTAVATDLARRGASREIWLNRGPLFDAIRASIAVPTVVAPFRKDGRLLVDGGVVNPVPVAPTLNDHTDVTIAVDLNGSYDESSVLAKHIVAPPGTYSQKIRSFIDRFRSNEDDPDDESVGYAEMFARSMEAMQATITEFKLAATAPSLVIRIPHNLCGFFDFYRATELIDYGYMRASQALADYERNVVG